MHYRISCSRCGNTQAVSPDTEHDWDEISCTECGEFLDTCGHYADAHAPCYPVHALNLSRGLILQMARASRPLNDSVVARHSA